MDVRASADEVGKELAGRNRDETSCPKGRRLEDTRPRVGRNERREWSRIFKGWVRNLSLMGESCQVIPAFSSLDRVQSSDRHATESRAW